MEYLINHSRFKRDIKQTELSNFPNKESRIVKFPIYEKNYYNFFNDYAKKNYQLVPNRCLCGNGNDIILSRTDRHCVNFLTVVCKNCGLIRAKDYFKTENLKDFYKNFYRTSKYMAKFKEFKADEFFKEQKISSKFKFDLLENYKNKELKNLSIIDIGGGVGGVLDHFDNSNKKFLFDFYDPFLEYAKSKNIKPIKGGLDKVDFKPDIVILSHVIEHWNNFEEEIDKLIKIQKKNQTLNYIEFPGVDSIKKGRREGDILGDIHVPHVFYFSSYVFENLMNRHGFEKVYLDSLIKSIFIYTGKKGGLINHYNKCLADLKAAEITRNIQILKNILKKIVPFFLIKMIRKIRNKKIHF